MSNNDKINQAIRRAAGAVATNTGRELIPYPEGLTGKASEQPTTGPVGTVHAGAGTGAPPLAHVSVGDMINQAIRRAALPWWNR